MRLAEDVAEQGARRVGTLAILTAVTIVAGTVIQNALQPELAVAHETPLFRSTALFLVLASVGLAALERSKMVRPQVLLDVGMLFEVVAAFAIGITENSLPWIVDHPVRGSTLIAIWIAVCSLAIPNKPWKSFTAALFSASMAPAAHLLCAHLLGYPPLPWNRLAGFTLSAVFMAGWTLFLSTRIYRMETELSHARELGSYRLESLLGKGGMGEVWRASHRLLRRDSAVKVVSPDALLTLGGRVVRDIRQRFEKEAQAIACLRSPHTVELYDFGVSDEGGLYYVMELLDGLDVDKLVGRYGPQPAGRVIFLIRQACDSLEEAHDLGLVHRDIKPSNLFVCRLGKQVDFLKVLDFGLVKAVLNLEDKQLTMEGVTQGTPPFMAPEQGLGYPEVDARADIYALGCVAYFLLTGELVFEERTPMATALAHIQKSPVPPSQRSELAIPGSLERVVMACLEKKPEDRPQSAAELARLLDACTDVPPWTRADALRWWEVHVPAPARLSTPMPPERNGLESRA
jgi:serine/threonine-protein kinase